MTTPEPDLNARQWRLINFAVRKSLHWDRAAFDLTLVVLSRPGSSRTLNLYQSGTTRRGMRVALIDPALPVGKSLRWISQRQAWTLIAEEAL